MIAAMQIPLFALHLVLFPGATCPLQVFEMRYRAMMEQVLAGDRRFGVVSIRHGMEVGGPAETYEVGTIALVEQVQRAEDGKMAILVRGTERFRILERLPDDPFPRAEIETMEEEIGLDPDRGLTHARAAIHRYLSVVARLQGSELLAPALGDDDAVRVSFVLADVLHIDLPDRQALLEVSDAGTRLRTITELARREAVLLDAVGPSVGRPVDGISLN